MTCTPTPLKGCYLIEPTVFKDDRGYFMESFNAETFQKLTGQEAQFVQDNQSYSIKGALRGLHFQKPPFAQAKLVRVLSGSVMDVAVDIRPESETFGKHIAVELSAENLRQLYIPRGFAHGFVVTSREAVFFYKCDNYYHKPSEGGIIYNDETLGIDWGRPASEFIISDKDLSLPAFSELEF